MVSKTAPPSREAEHARGISTWSLHVEFNLSVYQPEDKKLVVYWLPIYWHAIPNVSNIED